jgi:hypothetical protein
LAIVTAGVVAGNVIATSTTGVSVPLPRSVSSNVAAFFVVFAVSLPAAAVLQPRS